MSVCQNVRSQLQMSDVICEHMTTGPEGLLCDAERDLLARAKFLGLSYRCNQIPVGMESVLTEPSTSVHVPPSPPQTAQLSNRLSDSIRPSQPTGYINKTFTVAKSVVFIEPSSFRLLFLTNNHSCLLFRCIDRRSSQQFLTDQQWRF